MVRLPPLAASAASLALLALAPALPTVAVASAASGSGRPVPHSSVVKLTEKDFDRRLHDPANGLWLLKFYAPW